MAVLVQPDLAWKRRILGLDAHDLSYCYQCGTCTAVCPISTADNPFPRKEMAWVQWGLRERALGNASLWMCHQCGTCNTYCPRDAKPSNVMAALRNDSIQHYAVPKFMGRALNEPQFLPVLFALPAIVFLAILAQLGHLTALPEGQIVFSKFIPIKYIEVTFVLAIGLAMLAAVTGGLRYWRAMRAHGATQNGSDRRGGVVVSTMLTILHHQKFRECGDTVGTRKSHKEHLHRTHLTVFWGFVGLVATTTSVGIGIYAFGYLTPWPLWHPVKILGNVSGAAVIVALAVFSWRRIADKQATGNSTYSDWLFLAILALTTLTGFLSQGLRLAGTRIAYPVYFIHLMFIFFLLVYVPYSKFAHLVYRTVAMLHTASSARAKTTPGSSVALAVNH
jgi:quinone-modifying oxidoreductase subunit QmoC